jgi:hypothetical protein
MGLRVSQFIGVEEILIGRGFGRALSCPSEIRIGAEILVLIIQLEFNARIIGAVIIERCQHKSLTELPVV